MSADPLDTLRAALGPAMPIAVRVEAAAALGRLRDATAVDLLVESLDEPDDALRRAAAVALIEIDEPPAPAAVIELLGRDAASGEVAATALGRFDRIRAIGALSAVVEAHDDPQVRAAATRLLAGLAAPSADDDESGPVFRDTEGALHVLI